MDRQLLKSYDLTEDTVLEIIPTHHNDIVFLSGSIIEGFGNKGSDLDVYIITKEEKSLIPEDVPYKELSFGKEYTFLGYEILISAMIIREDNLKSVLHEVEDRVKNNQISVLNKKFLEFYHRMNKGMAIKNQNDFNEIVNLLDMNVFQRNICINNLKYSENRHEDAVGALESEDFWTALISARISLEKSVEGLLFIKGETNPSDKWLFRKLFNQFKEDEGWVKDFLNLYLGGNQELDLQERTIEMLRLANTIRIMAYDVYNLNKTESVN